MSDESSQTSQSDSDELEVRDAPTSLFGILRQLGPGLIVAGAIVGSGELIATTSTGAKAGIWLLWLIIVGCVIKVFVQVELGRYAISSGQTTMTALNRVPGPRIRGRGNWLIWYWFLMFLAGIAQLGGIVGTIGQALSIAAPLTEYGKQYDELAEVDTELAVQRAQFALQTESGNLEDREQLTGDILENKLRFAELRGAIASGENAEAERAAASRAADSLKSFVDREGKLTAVELLYKWRDLREELGAVSSEVMDPVLERFKAGVQPDKAVVAEAHRDSIQRPAQKIAAFLANSDPQTKQLVTNWHTFRSLDSPTAPSDEKIWATIIALATSVILYVGRFNLIQSFSTVMVGLFTLITIVNLFLLQSSEAWSFSLSEIMDGLKFRLPPASTSGSGSTLGVALATFGIIGVGASELVAYPYWCLEKGYGKFAGKRDSSEAWATRARGWMKIMRYDAWCSMVLYTFATIAFYLLGAAVLGRTKLEPAGTETIRYLAVMYTPAFGEWAGVLFLFGAFAVLYSTFFVANAGHARTVSDALQVLGFAKREDAAYQWRVRIMSGLFPIACLLVYLFFPQPVALVLLSGLMQALMLPMLAFAALFFRYRSIDRRIAPGMIWDAFLIVSAGGMFLFGFWAGWDKIRPYFFD